MSGLAIIAAYRRVLIADWYSFKSAAGSSSLRFRGCSEGDRGVTSGFVPDGRYFLIIRRRYVAWESDTCLSVDGGSIERRCHSLPKLLSVK